MGPVKIRDSILVGGEAEARPETSHNGSPQPIDVPLVAGFQEAQKHIWEAPGVPKSIAGAFIGTL